MHHPNVTEESISQSLALAGALDQASDVGDVEEGGHLAGGLVVLHQPVEPLIRHRDSRLVGVYRTEGEVLGGRHGGLGDHVEECGLANVGESHYTNL